MYAQFVRNSARLALGASLALALLAPGDQKPFSGQQVEA